MEMEGEDFLILDDDEYTSTELSESSKKPIFNIKNDILNQFSKIKKNTNTNKDRIPNTLDLEDSSLLALDGVYEFDWNIRGMDCPDCAMKASKAIRRLSGIEDCNVSATEGRVHISLDVARGKTSKVSSLLDKLGHSADVDWFSVSGQKVSDIESKTGLSRNKLISSISNIIGILSVRVKSERLELQLLETFDTKIILNRKKKLSILLGKDYFLVKNNNSYLDKEHLQLIGAILTIPFLLLIVLLNQIPAVPNLIIVIISLIGISFSSYYMFQEAIASIQNRILGFQVLTSLAVIGAFFLGEYPEALMVSGLVGLSAHLENSALIRAREAMQGGFDRIPKYARINANTPQSQSKMTNISNNISLSVNQGHGNGLMPIEAVNVGDNVEIRSGEIIPIDGTIIEGNGEIDKTPLTGEPMPVAVKKGDSVEAGLVLKRGPILVKCQSVGNETRLSGLMELVRKYRDMPTKRHTVIEKFTSIWVPFVLIIAPVIGVVTGNLFNTLILWVVSCPCSLLLASPVPHATALSVASKSGLVARGGDVLEIAAEIDLVLFDKTGTLTTGESTLKEIYTIRSFNDEEAISLASGLENKSNHPYAISILKELKNRNLIASEVSEVEDGIAGIMGKSDSKSVIIGRLDWLVDSGIEIPKSIKNKVDKMREKGYGISILAIDKKAVAVFSFSHDHAREGVKELIRDLQNRDIEIEILSGDEQKSVESFAQKLGLNPDVCRGGIDPEGKATLVSEKIRRNSTLMAGDGFNDAGALAVANLGIAIGSGEQVNLDAADVLIPGKNPYSIIKLIDLAKTTKKIVLLNISISVFITAMLVSTVLLGYQINLAAGIALHEASVFLVILNGMWISGNGISRFSTLISLFKDLKNDILESFSVLFQSFFSEPPSSNNLSEAS
jgi:Cd2+/Zn2+-exporting ATPase